MDQHTADPMPSLMFAFNQPATFTLSDGRSFAGNWVCFMGEQASESLIGDLEAFNLKVAVLDGGKLVITHETLRNSTPEDFRLRIEQLGEELRVSWPSSATGYVIEEADALNPASVLWRQVPVAYYQSNPTDIYITVPATEGNRFYRLRKP
jgi:hypothetical protein